MLKFFNYAITFSEVPNEINLCFSITNCQNHCQGCHSTFLRKDIGEELTINKLQEIIEKHLHQFTCICFLGEGNDKATLQKLVDYCHEQNFATCIYSGRDNCELRDYNNLDYYKIGSYKQNLGPLNSKNTNQKMFHRINENEWEDITKLFWPRDF